MTINTETTTNRGLDDICKMIEESLQPLIDFDKRDQENDDRIIHDAIDLLQNVDDPSFASTAHHIVKTFQEEMEEFQDDLSSMKYFAFFDKWLRIFNIAPAKWSRHETEADEDILNISRTLLFDGLGEAIADLCHSFSTRIRKLSSDEFLSDQSHRAILKECEKAATLPKSGIVQELFCKVVTEKVNAMEIEPAVRIDIVVPTAKNELNCAASQYAKLLTYLIDLETAAGCYSYSQKKQVQLDRSIVEFNEEENAHCIGTRGKDAKIEMRSFLGEVNDDLSALNKGDFIAKYTSLYTLESADEPDKNFMNQFGLDPQVMKASLNIMYYFHTQIASAFKAFRIRQSSQPQIVLVMYSSSLPYDIEAEIYHDALRVAQYISTFFRPKV